MILKKHCVRTLLFSINHLFSMNMSKSGMFNDFMLVTELNVIYL